MGGEGGLLPYYTTCNKLTPDAFIYTATLACCRTPHKRVILPHISLFQRTLKKAPHEIKPNLKKL